MASAQEICEMSYLGREDVLDIDDWISVRARHKYNIFLSYSGSQENFVEQLCKDLEEAKLSPFFAKRLPKAKEYAPLIFDAARKCEFAVVVISDDYFYKKKWPMVELNELVHASGCKILPLFFNLTCKQFKQPKRQERWFNRWNEWARRDSRIDLDSWKIALRKLGGIHGMELVKPVGELSYRKDIVSELCNLMEKRPQDEIIDPDECTSEGDQNLALHPGAGEGQFFRLASGLIEWTMIICCPFWFVALLKLVIVKIAIILIILYIVMIIIVFPVVRDVMQCLLESEHLNLENPNHRYRRHLE